MVIRDIDACLYDNSGFGVNSLVKWLIPWEHRGPIQQTRKMISMKTSRGSPVLAHHTLEIGTS